MVLFRSNSTKSETNFKLKFILNISGFIWEPMEHEISLQNIAFKQ